VLFWWLALESIFLDIGSGGVHWGIFEYYDPNAMTDELFLMQGS
jgi:hypothetical protein